MPLGLAGKSGHAVEANARGLLYTYNRGEDALLNDLGRLFLAFASATPTAGAARVFAHIANTSGRNLSVVEFIFTCTAGEVVDVFLGPKEQAALTGGTSTALTSLNGGRSQAPSVAFNVGVGITGFSSTAVNVDFLAITAANAVDRRTPQGQIVIPDGGILYAKSVTSGAAIKFGVILGYQPQINEVP